MSLLAGLGGIFITAVLLGSVYLFEPAARMWIDAHPLYAMLSFPLIFVAGFGMSLAFTLESQFRRGKWK